MNEIRASVQNASGILLLGASMAKQIRTKAGQIPIQSRLTAFDALWHNARRAVFVTIVAAAFTTRPGACRLGKEFKW